MHYVKSLYFNLVNKISYIQIRNITNYQPQINIWKYMPIHSTEDSM